MSGILFNIGNNLINYQHSKCNTIFENIKIKTIPKFNKQHILNKNILYKSKKIYNIYIIYINIFDKNKLLGLVSKWRIETIYLFIFSSGGFTTLNTPFKVIVWSFNR